MATSGLSGDSSEKDDDSIGVTQIKPKYPQYAVATKRKDSFKLWPEYLPIDPDVLVDAGLVYTGVGDSVRCFYCGGGLRNWEKGDIPWEEHARWYSSCTYLNLVKGNGYAERVKRGERPDIDSLKSEACESAYDPILSVAAQACMQMGYSKDLVLNAIIVYLKKSGGNLNFKATDLAEILIDGFDDERTAAASSGVVTDSKPENKNFRLSPHAERKFPEDPSCRRPGVLRTLAPYASRKNAKPKKPKTLKTLNT